MTYDYSNSYNTSIKGINDAGIIVGETWDSNMDAYGFMYDGTTEQYIIPNGFNPPDEAWGINNSGNIVGTYRDPTVRGFLYDGAGYTTGFNPGTIRTELYDINNSDILLGGYWTNSVFTSFTYDVALNSYSYFNFNWGSNIIVWGENDNDLFVGGYNDVNGVRHGFLSGYDGNYLTLDFPGASWTQAYDINNAGKVVGTYRDASNIMHGFLFDGQSFMTIDEPTAFWTQTFSINNNDVIVGKYGTTSNTLLHSGLIATPLPNSPGVVPEPVSTVLFLTGGVTLGLRRFWNIRKSV